MKLHQLRDVIAVADQGSLRAASRELGVAQSAITKSVQQLERELDAPLFERHKRGVIVTPAGAAFVQRARLALGELGRARDEIGQSRRGGGGSVTVSLSTVPHMAMLPAALGPFLERYPDVRLTLLEALGFNSAEPQMRSGAVDVYIGVAPAAKLPAEYRVEPLFRNARFVVARAGHARARAGSLRELVDERWAVSSAEQAKSGFAALFRRHHCRVPERLTFATSILSQLVLAISAGMLMIAPKQALEFSPYKGRLVRIPVREEIDAPSIVIVRRAASPLTPAAEYFCDLMRRAA